MSRIKVIKQVMLKTVRFCIFVCTILSFCMCSNDKEEAIEPDNNSHLYTIAGIWQVSTDEAREKDEATPTSKWVTMESSLTGIEIVFNEDGSGKWAESAISYAYESDKITIQYSFTNEGQQETWKVIRLTDFDLILENQTSSQGKIQYRKLTCNRIGATEQSNLVVLGESTVQLTSEQIKHVSQKITASTLIFDSSLKNEDLPKVGQILLNSEISDKFPYGFLGKVTTILSQGGQHIVKTEEVPLDVAFKELRLSCEVPLQPTDIQSKAFGDEPLYNDIEDSFTIPLTCRSEFGEIKLSETLNFRLIYYIDLRQKYVSASLRTIAKESIEIKAACEATATLAEKAFPIPLKVVNPVGIILAPSIELGFLATATGKISLTAEASHRKEVVSGFVYQNGEISQQGTREIGSPNNGFSAQGNILFEGSLFEGITAKVKIKIFNLKGAEIFVGSEFGFRQEAAFNLDMANVSDIYNQNKDARVTNKLELGFSAGISSIFSDEPLIIPLGEPKSKILREYYLFPEFDVNVVTYDEKLIAVVNTSVQRNLLMPTDIWIELMDEDRTLISVSEHKIYQKQNEFPDPWQVIFSGLDTDIHYIVHPCFKMFGNTMSARSRSLSLFENTK